ncbi:hypothetical protein BH09BAC4_BH09BAC4_35550 [soil metagenome]
MATENPRVWFKSISLENVRSFGTKQTIDFTDKDGNAARWNVILGDNGTGKTTVLKGLVYCFNKEMIETKYLIQFSRNDEIQSHFECSEEVKYDSSINTYKNGATIFKRSSIENPNNDLKFLALSAGSDYDKILFAYGAARRIGDTAITREVNSYVSNLFDDNGSLINAEEWFVQSDYLSFKDKEFESRSLMVRELILKLFQDEISDLSFRIVTINGGQVPKVFFKTHYGDVRLHELSLGYKTLIAWMVDFAKGLLDRYPNSENPFAESAVCLVDEIDLHLHPKFQRTIIQFLTDTFPNTQFIVTAHSPLIVQSAEDANIILLKREGDETHVADGIDVHSWRIDQILSSDLFGGVSGRAPQIEEKMARRRALLRKDERTPEEMQELNILEKELNELPVMETREALKAIDIISKAVITEG